MRLAVAEVVRFSVHDVPRFHTTSLHVRYRKALPNSEDRAVHDGVEQGFLLMFIGALVDNDILNRGIEHSHPCSATTAHYVLRKYT